MINNYKIVKELNKGYNGIAYLVEKDNKQYVIKRQKLLPKEVKPNYKYSIWREIDFSKFVNNLSKSKQKYFMKMYNYKINKCDYQHKPKYIDPSIKKDLIAKNKSKHCLDIVLEYKGNTLYNLIKNGLSLKEKYCLIIQVLYALEIMRSNKYLHQDIHQGNITYEKIKTHVKIYGKILPCKYQYSLIDYGLVRHPRYNKTKKDKDDYNRLFIENNDVEGELMIQIILQDYMLYTIYIENKWKFPNRDIKKELNLFKKDNIIWKKIKNLLYDKNKEWFNIFENDYKMIENWFVIDRIYILFSAYNRKKFLQIIGWKIYLPNFIPSKDVIFMVENIADNKKLIKYFLDKF